MIDEEMDDDIPEVRNSVPSEKFAMYLDKILCTPEEDEYLKSIKIKPHEQRLIDPVTYYRKLFLWSSFIQSKLN